MILEGHRFSQKEGLGPPCLASRLFDLLFFRCSDLAQHEFYGCWRIRPPCGGRSRV